MADGRACPDARPQGSAGSVGSAPDNCAREPIHIPARIQPHGALLSLRPDALTVCQASANACELLRLAPQDILDHSLTAVLGASAAEVIERHTQSFTDLRERNPLHLEVPAGPSAVARMDAVLHRAFVVPSGAGRLVVELEPSDGPRPFSFPNTYQAVRTAVAEMTAALTLDTLCAVTARRVRSLTGFDRVMIYRFDADCNGEVVAEDRRPDLTPFLGLHYPASDIPPQARALYEKNWLRVIPDVQYTPVPLLPMDDPDADEPLDLTFSVLRSVSPVHLEYLQNMGVRASMSISLLRDGALWGLIACHHYSGPHLPPFGVRAAAEFLGSTLSLRLVDRADEEAQAAAIRAERALAILTSRLADQGRHLALSLSDDLLRRDLVPADVVAVLADGRLETSGGADVTPEAMRLIHEWASRAPGSEPTGTDHIAADLPDLLPLAGGMAGVLAIALPGSQAVAWFRREQVRSVDWGGDPHCKTIAPAAGPDARIGPRTSFERWREIVRDRSDPWTPGQVQLAGRLRALAVEALYARERTRTRAAEVLQRSLLPDALPEVAGWHVSAWYEPAAGGRIGGDWYDAVQLPDGRVSVVVGDVAGHGLDAAGVMARFSNMLRAFLLHGSSPAVAVASLDAIVAGSYPEQMATLIVATFAPSEGTVDIISMGHLPPALVSASAVTSVSGPQGLPLGLAAHRPRGFRISVEPGQALVLFSDGLVERRTEPLDVGLQRLHSALRTIPAEAGEDLIEAVRDPASDDDQTLLVLRRAPTQLPGAHDEQEA